MATIKIKVENKDRKNTKILNLSFEKMNICV